VFLKTLTLKGFKSFADTTTLELEPGVTVVVGPNGSGKSNVVDAVAWALGAQGPRTVRSGKMEDVVFAGTADRPALGRAEVSLTIDNGSGLLPIDATEVTITRTLFRTGESEYAINGVACRLLDVQELLSDSGVGRTQHVIVGQGQLDAVLDARPEDRRAVIEEAAGILKYRRRKERAERRLAATEADLLRLGDLLREVRRTLRPLERQAEAARRHEDLAAEVSALRLHLAGKELASLAARRSANAATSASLTEEDAALRAELAGLDEAVEVASAELATGADDRSDDLVRVERLRERARGLVGVLEERRRGLERDREAAVDAAVVASLEADAARLVAELTEQEEAVAALGPERDRLVDDQAVVAAERASLPAPDDPVEARAAEARGDLAATRAAAEAAAAAAETAAARQRALQSRAARLADEATALRAGVDAAAAEVPARRADQAAAAFEHDRAEAAASEADAARRAAEAEHATWRARAEALAAAVDETRARAGLERVGAMEGVLGTLVDLVEADPGWERAFAAAVAPALSAVVVDGPAAARRALEALAATEGAAAAVLPLSLPRVPALAAPGEPLRPHVRARRPEVAAALDALLGPAVRIDPLPAAVDVAARTPGAVVVTGAGDRLAPDGWTLDSAGSGATAAAADDAARRADEAAATCDAAAARAAAAAAAVRTAAAGVAAATREGDEAEARHRSARAALERLDADLAEAGAEAAELAERVRDLTARVETEHIRVTQRADALAALEAEEASAAERRAAVLAARAAVEERAAAVAARRTELDLRASSLEERRAYLLARHEEVEARLARHGEERVEAEARRRALDARLVATTRLAEVARRHQVAAEEALEGLRELRRQASEAARAAGQRLDGLRRQRTDAERRLEELRERGRRAELEAQEIGLRVEAATESLRRDLGVEPDVAADAPCPPLPEGTTAAARVRELERELRLLGPINALALEELSSLQERAALLESQLDDVKTTRRELGRVIRAVDEEIVKVFTAAFADVRQHFVALFETLFPGGSGDLRLTDPSDPLTTGIDVEAMPSGKRVRRLSLLSGGERSLTALAFLFAVFRSRPSPFYLLDEVEAALDDVNLARFLDLLEEFRREAQMVVVSHQKRTMEVADVLYGVSLRPGGSSAVVREKLVVDLTA
jgi:chromosome segregation protein